MCNYKVCVYYLLSPNVFDELIIIDGSHSILVYEIFQTKTFTRMFLNASFIIILTLDDTSRFLCRHLPTVLLICWLVLQLYNDRILYVLSISRIILS